ncbi:MULTISPECIES: glycosyltransferase family 2 protein [unclassified Rhizobium]|uniref:glycosyltransferase family 2 protein n=1 Tax=unclassified Rhizobium TaxID=2613769 RepID=UPI000EA983C0|nr:MULTISPECIES: glycosyltransferase family 2 protein [unclassified Rhizobium]AYG68392.1 glycosyltransferase family 2 protein [Rhizobium sp. CCGE531]AYG74776.1 glycosyltransferase family 2 protein [Rhizobium sp. CCGE532]
MTDFIPDVSFVIAAYNAEETLERAIDSALAQGAVSMEVIVVDDCSTDGTREIAGNHTDPRVRLVAMARNGGPGAARNAGLDAARGRWVAVLDSDDALRPDRMARLIARAEKAEAQIAVDNLDVIREDVGTTLPMFPEAMLARITVLPLATFIASNMIFRSEHNFGYMKPVFERAFIEKHRLRFDETLRIGEDYIFLASALARGGICVVEPMVGYLYYIRDGSISRVLRKEHVEAMLAADARFFAEHSFGAAALAAQRRRTRNLKDVIAFLKLVDSIKERELQAMLKIACLNPRAVRHLSMPIFARFRRLAASLRSGREATTTSQLTSPLPNMGVGPHSNKG